MVNNPDDNSELINYIDTLNNRVWQIRGVPEPDFDAFTESLNNLEKAKSINYITGIAKCQLNLGMGSFVLKNDKQLALNYISEAFEIFKKLNDKKWIANTHLTLAIIYNTLANPEQALFNGLRGISYFEKNEGDVFDKIMAYYILGTIYKDLKKYDEAEKYYNTGIKHSTKINDSWIGRIYSSLANIYTHQQKYDQAIDISLKAYDILKSENNILGESRSLTDIGLIYKKQKKYDTALNYFFEGLKIRETNNLTQFVLSSLLEIGNTYCELNKNEEAIIYFKKAEKIALNLNIEPKLINIYKEIASAYKAISNFEESVIYYEKLFKISIIFNQNQLDIKLSNVNSELIREKEAEIEHLKNVELRAAYNIIELKNKEILESMRYASRIQKALLPSETYIKKNITKFKP